MQHKSDTIQINFDIKREEVAVKVDFCLSEILRNLQLVSIAPSIISKIKWTILEMLTNAVKHTGVPTCVIKIHIDNNNVIIERRDFGHPLQLRARENQIYIDPFQGENVKEKDFFVYSNGMDSLRLHVSNDQLATFYVEPLPEVYMPALLYDTSEHFGLLIITKASDTFTYERDHRSGVNIFRAFFQL